MSDDTQIPGFTPAQTWALKKVITEAVREANDHDERVAKLEECVFGNGREGLNKIMVGVQKDISSMTWWYRGIAVAVLGSWLTLLAKLIMP